MKHRLLIAYDVAKRLPDGRVLGWAYYKRALALQHWAPADFEVEIGESASILRERSRMREFDLIFCLEYAHARSYRHAIGEMGSRPKLVVSHNSDRHRRQELWDQVTHAADYVVANNRCVFDFHNRPLRTCNISNGIESRWWHPTTDILDRPHRVLWCGSSSAKKAKGYREVLLPAQAKLESLGFECDFRPIDDIHPAIVKTTDEQARWYNGGSYIVCAAMTEGTPGTSLEGMACGCCLVTTRVGNALEFGHDSENCVFIERTPDSLIEGLVHARKNRARLSAAAVETMAKWSYGPPGGRAEYYFALFRALIAGQTPNPFSYAEVSPEEIC